MGYGHCAHASRDACVYPVVRSIQEGLLRRGENGIGMTSSGVMKRGYAVEGNRMRESEM